MWSLLSRKWQLTLILIAALGVAWAADAVITLLSGDHPSSFKLISLAVTVVGGVVAMIAEITWRWIWRKLPMIQPRTFPDLTGTWRGTLVSTWVDPETGKPKPPIPTTITVRQRLFTTTVSLQTGESASQSTRAFLEPFYETRRFRIWYSYNNDPKAQVVHRSSPHEGVAFLEMNYDENPNKLSGRYYTARKTTGDIEIERTM